ncbi:MAG: FtsX-like permease family protein [Chloroflexi bacterium]|nr:FtsX-like permease family protein [Chloroflexota bacterium]
MMKRLINGLTRSFGRIGGMVWLSFERLRSAPELTAGMLIGLITVVTLISSIPMFVEASNNKVLSQELGAIGNTQHPAFSFLTLYSRLPGTTVQWSEVQAADAYFNSTVPSTMGLPLTLSSLYVRSDSFSLYTSDSSGYDIDQRQALTRMQTGFLRNYESHITLVDGQMPNPAVQDQPIEVLVSESKANEIGFRVGDEFTIYRKEEVSEIETIPRFEDRIRIVGIWKPTDASELFWFLDPTSFDSIILMPESSFASRIASDKPYAVVYSGWFQVFDGSKVEANNVGAVINAISRTRAQIASILPRASFPISPAWALTRYMESVTLQTRVLLTFSIPLIMLALGYVVFVTGLSLRQQRLEIALLKSRGTSTRQVVIIYLVQSLLLGVISLFVGLFLGRLMAQLMGQTRGFLSFGTGTPLRVVVTKLAWQLSIAAVLLASLATLIPALRWAGLTVVTFKQYLARANDIPWWRKYYVDILLLGLSLYGLYQMRKTGSLSFLIGGQGDPLQNPLLLIAPTLFIISLALVFLRIFPLVMDLVHWISRQLPGVVALLSFGRLARSTNYNGVLLLIIITVGLSVFTSSLAKTLDNNVSERAYYKVGADVVLEEAVIGATTEAPYGGDTGEGEDDSATIGLVVSSSDALQIPGVEAASRVVQVSVRADTGEQGRVWGIERLSFPDVAFFRRDFANRSLPALMNELAVNQSAALVNREYLAAKGLGVGDVVTVRVNNEENTRIELTVVGILDMLPTMYPDTESTMVPFYAVTNIGLLETLLGYPMTGQIWLSVTPGMDVTSIITDAQNLGFRLTGQTSALQEVQTEQGRLERVGLFGFLSVGFMIISFLSMLGLMIYAFINLRQWTIQFGVLRAIGLSSTQLVSLVITEQLVVVLTGMVVGAAFGIWMSYLFLPYLQVSYAATLPLPPIVVQVAWEGIYRVYGIIGAALLIVVVGMIRPLSRIRMFEAIKLGEAQSL